VNNSQYVAKRRANLRKNRDTNNLGDIMSTITVTAKTLDLALIRAAGQLGISSDKVGHSVKLESNGFLGMGKKIIIEAWNKADRKTDRRAGSKNKSRSNKSSKSSRQNRNSRPERTERTENTERTELSADQVAELKTELTEFLAGMVELSIGESIPVETREEDGRLVLNIESEYLAKQFTKNSKLAESFEHLLRKKPRHLRQELPFRVFVDADNVRVSRERELSDMAKELSDKVHNQNKPVVLNYRSSYDRKVIHMALDQDERVYTKSIGKGPNRKLMILPSTDGDEQGA
jgi:spoIIIJ-associated protein